MCGWARWPLSDVIGRSGLGAFDRSMEALRAITMRGTSEFDVRPFIAVDPDRVLKAIQNRRNLGLLKLTFAFNPIKAQQGRI